MTIRQWTNGTLRKELGEHGFFEVENSLIEVVPDGPDKGKAWRTTWERGATIVYLITREYESPTIENPLGDVLDIDAMGYRNPNAQQPDKGRGI